MDDMFIRDREDFVTVFVALLFLAKEGKIELRQRRFPRGEIMIKVLAPFEERISLMEMEGLAQHEEEMVHDHSLKEHAEHGEHELEEAMMVTA